MRTASSKYKDTVVMQGMFQSSLTNTGGGGDLLGVHLTDDEHQTMTQVYVGTFLIRQAYIYELSIL